MDNNSPNWWKYLLSRQLQEVQGQNPRPIPQRPSPLVRLPRRPFQITEEIKLAVWQKARTVPDSNPEWVRRDTQGSLMFFSEYGNCDSILGWQVDHIIPRSKGGSDLIANLQALNWKNNLRKGDKLPPPRSPRSL